MNVTHFDFASYVDDARKHAHLKRHGNIQISSKTHYWQVDPQPSSPQPPTTRLLDIGGRGGRPPILKVLIRWKNRLNGGKMVHISQRLAIFRRKPREFS